MSKSIPNVTGAGGAQGGSSRRVMEQIPPCSAWTSSANPKAGKPVVSQQKGKPPLWQTLPGMWDSGWGELPPLMAGSQCQGVGESTALFLFHWKKSFPNQMLERKQKKIPKIKACFKPGGNLKAKIALSEFAPLLSQHPKFVLPQGAHLAKDSLLCWDFGMLVTPCWQRNQTDPQESWPSKISECRSFSASPIS